MSMIFDGDGILRLSIVVNGGMGNPDQVKIICPWTGVDANHDKFMVNVRNECKNYVLFTRPKTAIGSMATDAESTNPACAPKLNTADFIQIFDFIYDLAVKKYYETDISRNEHAADRTLLVDCSLDDFEIVSSRIESLIDPRQFLSPSMIRWENLCQQHYRTYHSVPKFEINFTRFSPEECHRYFFPRCEQYGTPMCCRVMGQQS